MASAFSIKASYRRACREVIVVRRYLASSTGSSRPFIDATVHGRAQAYGATELIGGVVQGDTRVIVLAEDILAQGLTLPLTTNDKIRIKGKEIAIMVPMERKALDGTLIAYELQCRG